MSNQEYNKHHAGSLAFARVWLSGMVEEASPVSAVPFETEGSSNVCFKEVLRGERKE